MSVPTITIIVLGGLFINNISSLTPVSSYFLYAGIVIAGFLDIIITYSLFAKIQDRLRQSYIKISDWTNKIKSGDLTTRLTFSKNSDLYYIAEAFNSMKDIMQELIVENENKIQELNDKNELLLSTNKDLCASLVNAIEAKDKYTLGHSERVADYSVQIAKKLKLSDEDIEDIRVAGMLHDVGKIGISDDILNKTSRLTNSEFEEVKKHPAIGSWILNTLDLPENTMNAINYHHERFDGKGYPLGLKGKELSLSTQIVSLSDAYDAMTSDRPYRKAMTHEEAICELKKCSNTQFNPDLVALIEKDGFEVPSYENTVSAEAIN